MLAEFFPCKSADNGFDFQFWLIIVETFIRLTCYRYSLRGNSDSMARHFMALVYLDIEKENGNKEQTTNNNEKNGPLSMHRSFMNNHFVG